MIENKKLYRITNNYGGFNKNVVTIETVPGSIDSVYFVTRLIERTKSLFNLKGGGSLDAISFQAGLSFRFEEKEKNKRLAKLIIDIVKKEREALDIMLELKSPVFKNTDSFFTAVIDEFKREFNSTEIKHERDGLLGHILWIDSIDIYISNSFIKFEQSLYVSFGKKFPDNFLIVKLGNSKKGSE